MPTAWGLAARLAFAELNCRGIVPAPLLARSHLSAAALADRRRISVISQIKFLELASAATGDDWFGLTLGEGFDLRETGMLYYVAASSHRLRAALMRLERYARIGNEALVVRIRGGKACRVGFSYAGVSRHEDRHQMELFAVGLLRLCRQLVARKVLPRSAQFVHHRSGDLRRIRNLLGCDVQFDAPVDEISFDPEVVDLPLVGYDPFLNELMVNDCEAAIAARGSPVSSFRAVVENAIAPLLPHAEAQAKTVARKLGLSERTFARRLASEGLTFGRILGRDAARSRGPLPRGGRSADLADRLAAWVPAAECFQSCQPPLVWQEPRRISSYLRAGRAAHGSP